LGYEIDLWFIRESVDVTAMKTQKLAQAVAERRTEGRKKKGRRRGR
jgi:hypothetical protein